MTKIISKLILGAFVATTSYAMVEAQSAASVNDGVYTQDQAKRGEVVYKEQCAACHGDNLAGSGPMPPLAGKDFLAGWNGKSIADLYDKTHDTMPATAPGTMTPAQTTDVVAYMLSASNYPTGATELATQKETLATIKLDLPK